MRVEGIVTVTFNVVLKDFFKLGYNNGEQQKKQRDSSWSMQNVITTLFPLHFLRPFLLRLFEQDKFVPILGSLRSYLEDTKVESDSDLQ